jgi:signal transduction histidine kinase
VLAETQQILRVLRVGSELDPVGPTPSHDRIPELVATFRAAGLQVDADLAALNVSLPPEASAATFRITQEALTNAQRYDTGPVALTVRLNAEGVSITVINAIRAGPRGSGGGNGLVGMRERALSAGGRLDVRGDGRLFRLAAEMPLHRGAPRRSGY